MEMDLMLYQKRSSLSCYPSSGPDDVLATWAHVVEDAMSDTVAKTITPEGRDVWENLLPLY